MFGSLGELEQLATEYANARGLQLKHRLGVGKDGCVISSDGGTDIKAFFAKRQEFGSEWGKVMVILHVLEEQFGIFRLNVHPGNISFGDGIC